jgi:fatty acid desaturase 2 (delta-6 desaturase)
MYQKQPLPAQKLITIDGATYDITNFEHPGGSIIGYAIGLEDAGDTFREFHARSKSARIVLNALPKVENGNVDSNATSRFQRDMIRDYRDVRETLTNIGCFEPDPIHVYFRLLELAFFFGLGVWLAPYNIYASMLAFVLFKTRCGWVQHEGGHLSLTGNKTADRTIQAITMGLAGGLSGTFWNTMHHKHHAAPQKIKHDIDLDTTPAVAFFKTAFEKNTNGPAASAYMSRWWMRMQAWLFLPVTNGVFVHLFWTYYLHPKRVLSALFAVAQSRKKNGPTLEAVCMLSCHTVIPIIFYFRGDVSVFSAYLLLMVCNFWNVIYLFGHFSLSHTFTDVIPETEHRLWFEYAIRHSVNISNKSALVSWAMGYLNFQIEHHLFPSMPQHKNAIAAPHVRAFCARWNGKNGNECQLKYVELGYVDAWRKMFANLSDVGMHYYKNGVVGNTGNKAAAHYR